MKRTGQIKRTSWQKGQSGNPGGRPKIVAEVRELAREHGPRAIARLVELMEGEDGRVAVRAAEVILDRGYGRAIQGVEMSGPGVAPIQTEPAKRPDLSVLSVDELKIMYQLSTKVYGATE